MDKLRTVEKPPKFDPEKPHGRVMGHGKIHFFQEMHYYDAHGRYVGSEHFTPRMKNLMDKNPSAKPRKELLKEVAASATVPKELVDAQRENAAAKAAEEGAG